MEVRLVLLSVGHLETGCEQCSLGLARVVDKQVQVVKGPERRVGIARGDLRTLQQQHRSVVRVSRAREHLGRRQRRDRRQSLLVLQLRWNWAPLSAQAARRERGETVQQEVSGRGRAIDQLVDARPDRVLVHPRIVDGS